MTKKSTIIYVFLERKQESRYLKIYFIIKRKQDKTIFKNLYNVKNMLQN